MPVTAKLSQAFYDRLGHQVADEMVDWFNQVDAANHNSLRELNELNFARFDAKLDQRFAESDRRFAEWSAANEKRSAEWSAALDRRFAESEKRFAEMIRGIEREFADLRVELMQQHVVQMRWMVGMWTVVVFGVMGLWIRR